MGSAQSRGEAKILQEYLGMSFRKRKPVELESCLGYGMLVLGLI